MKHLKGYKLFENINDEDIIMIEDIFFDLIHDDSSIDVSFPGRKFITREPADIIRIIFNEDRSRGSFNPGKYIDSFYHLDNFLKSKGYKYFSDGSWYDTHEKLMKSFENGGNLLLLSINYIKE